MTKENFITKWGYTFSSGFIKDLEAVIANEIAKVKDEKTNKIEITPHTLVEVNRAFRALKQDRNSYIHKVFSDDGVFDAMEEIRQVHEAYFGSEERQIKPEDAQPQPAPKYPIGGYAPGHYTCICSNCKIEFMGDKRAVQCEPCAVKTTSQPTDQVTDQVQHAKPFDKDRFERMFRAVVASGKNEHWEEDINVAKWAIEQLDAYYAEKEKGGNNG